MPFDSFQSLDWGRLSHVARLAPNLSSFAIIALIAWTLADSTLTLLAPSHVEPTDNARLLDSQISPNALNEAGALFGNWENPSSAVADALAAAPSETKLPLHLIGVFVSDVQQDSGAIIASGQGAGKRYEVGEKVPGNATLESVEVDGVMIRRGARIERLSFPDSTLDDSVYAVLTPNPSRPVRAEPAGPAGEPVDTFESSGVLDAPSLAGTIEDYRTLASKDPNEALNQLGLQPIKTNDEQGYRVGSLPENDWVRQSGLQDGDILLSVNGRRVGNPDLDRLEIDNLFAEGQVRLEIQRGERRFFVSAKLSP